MGVCVIGCGLAIARELGGPETVGVGEGAYEWYNYNGGVIYTLRVILVMRGS